ncbi:hypothetical protein DITRI_Ditri06bG0144000 [Diplodiscus trichospermus]
MDIPPSCLLFFILVHGLVLQTSHASRKLPAVMVQAQDIHDVDAVEAGSTQVTKLSAQMEEQIVRRIGKQIPIRRPPPLPNGYKICLFLLQHGLPNPEFSATPTTITSTAVTTL